LIIVITELNLLQCRLNKDSSLVGFSIYPTQVHISTPMQTHAECYSTKETPVHEQ